MIGDSGTANANAAAVRDAYKSYAGSQGADLWLMLGDNAYADGTDAEYQAAVFDFYPEILRKTPLWPTLGNHDGHSADSASQTGPYYDIFTLPTASEAGVGWPSGTEAYYSFDYGNIHFISLESFETDRSVNGAMLQWLEADLQATDKKWIIAIWHHPPYSKGNADSDTGIELREMRENALPILEQYGVDLVMGGHSHSYERSYLLDGHYGSSDTLTPSMVLDGGDGHPNGDGGYDKSVDTGSDNAGAIYVVAGSSGKISSGPLDHPAMHISLLSLGSMLIDVDGDQMTAVFIDDSGAERDRFVIVKAQDTSPPAVVSSEVLNENEIRVSFSETMSSTAEDPLNYAINNGVNVTGATFDCRLQQGYPGNFRTECRHRIPGHGQ